MLFYAFIVCTFYTSTVSAACNPATFKCDADNTKIFYYLGSKFLCPNDQICNTKNLEPCDPCISSVDLCKTKFSCNAGNVIIDGNTYECPAYHQCNANYEEPCLYCIPKKCLNTPQFKCFADDPTKVNIQNIDMFCSNGYICNKDNVEPCIACIEDPKIALKTILKMMSLKLTATKYVNQNE